MLAQNEIAMSGLFFELSILANGGHLTLAAIQLRRIRCAELVRKRHYDVGEDDDDDNDDDDMTMMMMMMMMMI